MSDQFVTTIQVQGAAEADYALARLSLSITAQAETPAFAKAKVRTAVDAVERVLTEARESGGLVPESKVSSMQTGRIQYGKKAQNKQYQVTYSMAFEVSNLEKVSALYDQLSEIELVEVGQPVFRMKDDQLLTWAAMKSAKVEADRRFREECELLGKNPEDYQIATWHVNRHEHQHGGYPMAFMAASAGGVADQLNGPEPMQLMPGRSRITVHLSLQYEKK